MDTAFSFQNVSVSAFALLPPMDTDFCFQLSQFLLSLFRFPAHTRASKHGKRVSTIEYCIEPVMLAKT